MGRDVGGLTHLAVKRGTVKEVIRGALESCQALRVFVIVLGLRDLLSEAEVLPKDEGDDLRVVKCFLKTFVENWWEGALGGRDFWVVAGEEVERRFVVLAGGREKGAVKNVGRGEVRVVGP